MRQEQQGRSLAGVRRTGWDLSGRAALHGRDGIYGARAGGESFRSIDSSHSNRSRTRTSSENPASATAFASVSTCAAVGRNAVPVAWWRSHSDAWVRSGSSGEVAARTISGIPSHQGRCCASDRANRREWAGASRSMINRNGSSRSSEGRARSRSRAARATLAASSYSAVISAAVRSAGSSWPAARTAARRTR